jgi:hypothetical protein
MPTGTIPSCQIRIDKEGMWYYKGAEMFRKEIVNFFYQNLQLDEAGRYLIELENDRCYLEVEDTAYVVRSVRRSVSETSEEQVCQLLLSDDTVELLDPGTLRIGKDNVLYCRVKTNRFEARFLRAAYYQLADGIEYDPERDAYYLPFNGERYYCKDDTDRQNHFGEA